jgi:hypothetical protein
MERPATSALKKIKKLPKSGCRWPTKVRPAFGSMGLAPTDNLVPLAQQRRYFKLGARQ